MNSRKLLLAAFLLAAAAVAGWRWHGFLASQPDQTMLHKVTMTYSGTMGGLFKELDTKSGQLHDVTSEVASLPVSVSYNDQTLRQIQDDLKEKANLRYSPPGAGSSAIKVELRKK